MEQEPKTEEGEISESVLSKEQFAQLEAVLVETSEKLGAISDAIGVGEYSEAAQKMPDDEIHSGPGEAYVMGLREQVDEILSQIREDQKKAK